MFEMFPDLKSSMISGDLQQLEALFIFSPGYGSSFLTENHRRGLRGGRRFANKVVWGGSKQDGNTRKQRPVEKWMEAKMMIIEDEMQRVCTSGRVRKRTRNQKKMAETGEKCHAYSMKELGEGDWNMDLERRLGLNTVHTWRKGRYIVYFFYCPVTGKSKREIFYQLIMVCLENMWNFNQLD